MGIRATACYRDKAYYSATKVQKEFVTHHFLQKKSKKVHFSQCSNPASLMAIRATACYSNFKVQKEFAMNNFMELIPFQIHPGS